MERMTAKRIDSLRKPGRYRADQTLYLIVEPEGSKHWVQRIVVAGRRRDLGLGSYPLTSLAEARERAYQNRRQARQGGDLLPPVSRLPTIRQAAEKVEAASASQWRGRTAATRRAALETYAYPVFGDLPIDKVTREHTLRVLSPLWVDKAATARTLRGWIRGVLSWAQAHGHVEPNVAGEMIDGALPKAKQTREHRAALPYQDVCAALRAVDASTAGDAAKACLRFIALTAVRSGEARLATWEEIDLDARTWRIPASRMKAGAEHRVPLSGAAYPDSAQRSRPVVVRLTPAEHERWKRIADTMGIGIAYYIRSMAVNLHSDDVETPGRMRRRLKATGVVKSGWVDE